MSTGSDKFCYPVIPDWHGRAVVVPLDGSAGFARHRRRPNLAALLISVILTTALIGMMLLVSGVAGRDRPAVETLVVIPLARNSADAGDLPKEKPVDEPEELAESVEDAARSSSPRAVTPTLSPPLVPPAAFDLSPVLPQAPVGGEGPKAISGVNSEYGLTQGPTGRGGDGSDGVAGNGRGGAGRGKGDGNKLIASWAPDMDFSQNHRYFPARARRERIDGAVLLDCYVLPRDRVRDCKLVAEEPPGYGFGKAALRTEKGLRIRVHNQAGQRVYNQRVTVISYFVLSESEASEASTEEKKGR